jgi:N-6 DNA Methylase
VTRLPGISGSLLPEQFLATAVSPARDDAQAPRLEHRRRQLERWWQVVASRHGPATGLHALFDDVAMPLVGALGFRASDGRLERGRFIVRLDTPASTPVSLIVAPWASRASLAWRELATAARGIGADWCFLLGPPFLSLVDVRGHASRRGLEFRLPDVFDPRSFAPFWTLAHAGAFDPAPGRAVSGLDALVAAARGFQDRVRADLQLGVTEALRSFRPVIAPGAGAFDESLTLVYRMLFLFFAESRDLVPRAHPLYAGAYALGAQCRAAAAGGHQVGLWEGLAAITRLLRTGCRIDDLVVAPFNGRLFARASASTLEAGPPRAHSTPRAARRDAAVQRALVALGMRAGRAGLESINYADLGVEQLGAVYERVLDLDPDRLDDDRADRDVRPGAHSARRKQTGTFYTPQPLAGFVVRRTLAPLVAGATSDAILSLRIVDPAMGSGAFLVAACRYLAAAYARALVDEGRCAETDLDERERASIRRLVAERCLAGVDVNPVAVQLARLSLWLTTLAAGKPLGFLDHRLRVGNSLVGASPDDLRRLSMKRASTDHPLFDLEPGGLEDAMSRMARPLVELAERPDDTVADVRAKEAVWARLTGDASPLRRWRDAADLWCARWFWPGMPPGPPEVRAALDGLLRDDRTLGGPALGRWLDQARAVAAGQRFFHWPLEFADVFYRSSGEVRPRPGFDAVIGNPPWEMLRKEKTPGVFLEDSSSKGLPGSLSALVRFIRDSGLYPSCDRGHLNLYQPFLERSLSLTRFGGRTGLILPWGLAVDDGAAGLRARLLDRSGLETLVGLDNAEALFPIHRGMRFLVIVARAGGRTREVRARFGVRTCAQIDDLPDRDDPDKSAYPIRLNLDGLARSCGRTRRLPDARSVRDLELLEHVAAVGAPLGSRDGWNVQFGRDLNATDDRASFSTRGLPVIEGKHLQPFVVDVNAASVRIAPDEAARRFPDRRYERPRLAYRDVSAVANRLSLIAAIVPPGVLSTHTVFCLRTPIDAEREALLCGLFNSFVLNAIVRMLMGGHLTTSLIEDLPVPAWTGDEEQRRISRLARRLGRHPASARSLSALQAAVARLYRLDAAMFAHVLAGFPLVPEADRRRALDAFAL